MGKADLVLHAKQGEKWNYCAPLPLKAPESSAEISGPKPAPSITSDPVPCTSRVNFVSKNLVIIAKNVKAKEFGMADHNLEEVQIISWDQRSLLEACPKSLDHTTLVFSLCEVKL